MYNICIDIIRSKIKDNLRTFEPDNQEILRTSQPEKIFTGPYKKKECSDLFTFLFSFLSFDSSHLTKLFITEFSVCFIGNVASTVIGSSNI